MRSVLQKPFTISTVSSVLKLSTTTILCAQRSLSSVRLILGASLYVSISTVISSKRDAAFLVGGCKTSIDIDHLRRDGIPGELALHPFPASAAHFAERHRANALDCRGKTFRVVLDPQAAADIFDAAPRRSPAGNNGY